MGSYEVEQDELDRASWQYFLDAIVEFIAQTKNDEPLAQVLHRGLEVFLKVPDISAVGLFLLDEENFDFKHALTLGKSDKQWDASGVFDVLLEIGALGMALGVNASVPYSFDFKGDPVALYIVPLTIPSGVLGIAILKVERSLEAIEQMVLRLSSLHASQLAALINTSHLVANLKQTQEILEQKVVARTLSIEQTKRELATILEVVQAGIVIVDARTLKILNVNPAAAALIAADKEDIIGDDVQRYLHIGIHEQEVLPEFGTAGATEERGETDLHLAGGGVLPVYFTAVAVRLNNNPVYIESFFDISERKKAEAALLDANEKLESKVRERTEALERLVVNLSEQITERQNAERALILSEERLQKVIESSLVGVAICNDNGTFEYVNPAFARMISSQPDDLKGTEFIAVLPHEDREQWQKNIEKLQADSVNIEGEALLLSRNNDIVTVLNNTAIITGMDGLRQVVSFMLDITERKRAEVEIQKALEREKELSELKSRFVAMISHEFRTPLTIINSTTQLLERFQRNLNPDQQKEYLSRIQKAVQRMNNLISDVLFIGKAEANKVSFNPQLIDVVDVCGNIVKDVAFADNNKHDIRYTVHGEGYQRLMDEKLLQHIITNLLSNATKYSPEADKVDFDLVLEEHQAIFKVRDYGIGIPEEDQKHMFQDFHRASNVGTISGTGLGMAIVKNSAQLHGGGNVTFFSKVGEGTTFTVILPYAKNGV